MNLIDLHVFFIDEFQHAKVKDVQEQLKIIMLEAQVMIVPVGIPTGVNEILAADSQLKNRCPVKNFSKLSYWKDDKSFRRFLAGYEKFLPFPEPSNLAKTKKARKIFNAVKLEGKSYTNLRNIAEYLKMLSTVALKNEMDNIADLVAEKIKLDFGSPDFLEKPISR
ncbi:MAG: hypothetical protein ACTSP4_01635 [Candidatus Hodarchaeales archaeon]